MGILGSRQRLGLATLMLAASAFLSRLMGLIRDKIISWQFGAGSEADLYFAAFVVPDIINYLLAGAFISITIMPLLAKGFADDADEAWKFFSCILFWMAFFAIAFTIAGMLLAPELARLIAPGFETRQLTRLACFMRIILPAQIFFLVGSCFSALLLLRRQFAVPSLSPLIYNGMIILSGLLWPWLTGEKGMTGYCVGVSLGAFAGAFALPMSVAVKGGVHIRLTTRHPWLRKFLYLACPLMLGQTVIMLDEQFLRVFGSYLAEGNISLLNYARRVAQVPIALMGQAIAVASYPFLVSLLAKGENEIFAATLRKAMLTALLLIIPCAMLMTATAQPILEIIFQGGRFGPEQTAACAPLTRLLLLASPFWIIYMVLVRGFYAFEDTLTPALTGTLVTLVCIPCYYLMAVPAGAWAIALVSAASVSLYVVWLMLIWLKRHGPATFMGLGKDCLAVFMLSLPGALAAWQLCEKLTFSACELPFILRACIQLGLSSLVFTVICAVLLYLFKPDFIKFFKAWLARRRA